MKIGILWDLDGTLLDTLQDLADATNHTLEQYGFPKRSLEEVRQFVGNGARQLIALSMGAEGNDPRVDEVLENYQVYYKAHSQVKTKPYDGILNALKALGEKYPMAIVSNKPDGAVKILCEQYFPGIYARGESADCPRKPAPDMVFKAMADIGVEKCIYVGDSDVDVLTANNAGMPCLSVTWGFRGKEELKKAGAKYLCEKPETLPQMMETVAKENFR